MQRAVDRDDVADRDHVLDAVVPGDAQLLLDRCGQPVAVEIMEMHVERLQAAQHGAADPPGGDGADVHALDIVGARDAIGDVPAALRAPSRATADNCGPGARIIITTCSATLIELQ